MAPQKGKQGTRGAKQIVHENQETIKFYKIMSCIATAAQLGITGALFLSSLTSTLIIIMTALCIAIHTAGYKFFTYVTKASYSESGQLLDSGVDLNMEGGISEHVKDIIILTSATQVLSLVSNYFWLVLLLIPFRAFHILWKTVLGPWFFQEAPQEPEMSEKKQKKMERKKMRQN